VAVAALITVSLVEQVDQEAAVLEALAEMLEAQETLLPLLHLKETLEELALQVQLFLQELEKAEEAAAHQLLE